MKILFYLILFIPSLGALAQPGDIIGWKINQVTEINALLKVDPENRVLIWKRLDLLFNPHFNIYSQTQTSKPTSDSSIDLGNARMKKIYKNLKILKDINFLLSDTSSIIFKNGYTENVTSSNFYYKRGQYYYLNGKPKQAVIDYLTALNLNPNTYLKNRICISLAAYYYNLVPIFNINNLEKALIYIDRAIPKEIENTPETFESFTGRNHHPFEREKIMLLELTKKDERLKNYLKSLAKSHLNLYAKEIKESESYQKNNSYTISSTLESGLNYLFQVAKNYYKAEKFEKSKRIIVLISDYIPRNKINYKPYSSYFLMLQEIYSTYCCKDSFYEIENLLNIAGSPTYNLIGKNVNSELINIDKHIKSHPKNPKLFLAKAILIYKSNKSNLNPTILNLLDTVQNLELVDYRIHYLRGLVFKQQQKYKEALSEFDNAIALFEYDPFIYYAKIEILQKIPGYDTEKIQALHNKIKHLHVPVKTNIKALISQIGGV